MTTFDPLKVIQEYFMIQIAATESLKEAFYHLRYEIFCQEFGFESESACNHQLETDVFDANAIHALLFHKISKKLVGGIRVILPSHSNALVALPFEAFTDDCFLPQQTHIQHYGEASRLAVHPEFRRRRLDGKHASGINSQIAIVSEREFPVVGLSMMLMGVQLANLLQLESLYAMMEPKLSGVMHGYGIHFHQIGQLANYHGERAPYALNPHETLTTIHPSLSQLLTFIGEELGKNMPAKRIA